MVRPRTRANQNPQELNLANVVATLQRQLQEQQRQTNQLREQIARMNQVPPVAPQVPVPEVQRMKASEFEGPTDRIAADNWLIDIQVILDFMRLTEQEKVLCASFTLKKDARHWWMTVQIRRDVMAMSWQDFVAEFRTMYYNREILAAQQDEFTSLKQGTMTILEAVKKFEQLARLCPELVLNETEKVKRMMKMFRKDIAKQDKEARAQFFKTKKEKKAVVKQLQPRQNVESYVKGHTSNFAQGSKQLGRNKRKWNVTGQGQQRNYPQKKSNRGNEGNNNEYPELRQSAACSPSKDRRPFDHTRKVRGS
ncbi:hypothetical protein TIFTF001_017412 [Ficus carica]|uniref:Retrotransposon gag domain-containing protein n=1 Tax=Ficus carica TaxID=3494 RepID=A0AA88AAL5_FICCA|nr:hypothetical protein TIFTF001_017412 [Ficus carica]